MWLTIIALSLFIEFLTLSWTYSLTYLCRGNMNCMLLPTRLESIHVVPDNNDMWWKAVEWADNANYHDIIIV